MKKLLAIAAVGLLGLAGCNNSTPGGPGATNRDKGGPNLTTKDNTFTLDAPNLQTTLKQGETKTVNIGISRGTNFDQDVKLDFSTPPQGVKITSNPLKAKEKETPVTIEAAKDAALGEHIITVTGTPAKGETAKTTFKIQIDKAD